MSEGKAAIVTGGARGIGRAVALSLAKKGYNIAVWDVLDERDKAAKELASLGVKAAGYGVDITDPSAVDEATRKTVEDLGAVEILVNNAGITRDNILLRMKDAEWNDVLAVNLKGVFNCIRAVGRKMRKTGGAIVNVSSVVGLMGNVAQANYSASKAGVVGLTKSAAKELARYRVRVNAVAPGFIETEMTKKLGDAEKTAFVDHVPLGRAGTAEEVAEVIAFLATPASSYVTGQVLQVCGGLLM